MENQTIEESWRDIALPKNAHQSSAKHKIFIAAYGLLGAVYVATGAWDVLHGTSGGSLMALAGCLLLSLTGMLSNAARNRMTYQELCDEYIHQLLTNETFRETEIAREHAASAKAAAAADARHGAPGGSRAKQEAIRQAWASGKYTNRDRCAEEECGALGMSFSAARKALRNTPDVKIT